MNITKRKKLKEKIDDKLDDKFKKKPVKQKYFSYKKIIFLFIFLCFFFLFFLKFKFEKNLVKLDDQYSSIFVNNDKKWGTFRSSHYFGLKTLAEKSLVFGFMWFDNKLINNNLKIKHWCDQSDNLIKYGWLKHDFNNFGVQEIIDDNLNYTFTFIIDNTSSWKAKIEINPLNQSSIIDKQVSLVPYFALDSLSDNEEIYIKNNQQANSYESIFFGKTKVFKNGFNSKIKTNKNVLYFNSLNSTINPPLLNIKEKLIENLFLTSFPGKELDKSKYLIVLNNKKNKEKFENSNLALNQLIVNVPFTLEIEFSENESNINNFESKMKNAIQKFDSNFENKFKLKEKGYNEDMIKFAQAALSNMIGSIGSFYGYSKVKINEKSELNKNDEKIFKYGPLRLLTSVPSRSFFPRGFLWDEGFHLLLISEFDLEISKTILSSWLSLMNKNGWIPREVILGVEAEARVPQEFIVQNTHVANPPTFFLSLESILNKLIHNENSSNLIENQAYLKNIYEKLVIWYDWYNSTQKSFRPGAYKWKGRDPTILRELNVKTLSSGLDDFPRASTPSDEEIHVDLFSWMAYSTKIMYRISNYLNYSSKKQYENYYKFLTERNKVLDDLHWSEENEMYCDFGIHSKKVILASTGKPNQEKIRKEIDTAKYRCINEFGYVSIFPLILQILEPDNPKLEIILKKIRDPYFLWSKFGLRSLSKNSYYYKKYNTQHDPPYWRGPIWVNINYLVLKSLDYYSNLKGPYQDLAKNLKNELKINLINNLFYQYKKSNYIWENYDDETGKGKGCYPFSGWTALVVLIMSEKYN